MKRESHRTSQYGGSAPATPGFNAVAPEWLSYGAALAAPAVPAAESTLGVAVGTSITARPPHRSVRAGLPHTAPPLDMGVEAYVRIRMQSAWARNPSFEDRPQTVPIGLAPLTTAAQNMPPETAKPFSEARQHREVARHCVVAVIAVDHQFQPRSDALH